MRITHVGLVFSKYTFSEEVFKHNSFSIAVLKLLPLFYMILNFKIKSLT